VRTQATYNTGTTTSCTHCGEICADGTINDGEHVFCCTGCASVYALLQEHDLCAYYQGDVPAGTSQQGVERDSTTYAILDDRSVSSRFIEYADARRFRVRFALPTIHCASCVWLLERLPHIQAGLISTEVDLQRKSITIDADPRVLTVRSIAELLRSVGYEPLIHVEGTEVSRLQQHKEATRGLYLRLGVAGFAMGNIMMFSIAQYLAHGAQSVVIDPVLMSVFTWLSIGLSIPVLTYSASPWLRSAWAALRQRTVNLDVPVALGITTLFVRSVVDMATGSGEGFLDSFAGLVFFLLIGRVFQQKAFDAVTFDRTVRSFFPLSVRRSTSHGDEVVAIDALNVADTIVIRNGEVIPADAVLMSPVGYVDYSFVTGESVPVECTHGALIYAGGKAVGAALQLTVTKPVSQSYLASLWERSSGRTSRDGYRQLSDRFGKWFVWSVLAVASIGFLAWLPDVSMALNVFTAVVIIACPCALTLAAPITFGTGMGILGRMKMYAKNIGVLRTLAAVRAVVFDKTGTLTSSQPAVAYHGEVLTRDQRDAIIAVASQSTHPMSRGLAAGSTPLQFAEHVEEIPGYGITGTAGGHQIAIGSESFIKLHGFNMDARLDTQSTLIAIDGVVVGEILVEPSLRAGVPEMILDLRGRGMQCQVVTGDSHRDQALLSESFRDDEMTFRATPADKVAHLEQLREASQVLMIGDGLNDMSAMAVADVSIAVTENTSTLAPASDMIIPATQVHRIGRLLRYAHALRGVVITALWFTMAYNVAVITIALTGQLTPVITAIMMPLSSLLVIGISVGGAHVYARRLS
jgi:Cu+-exporting ATPase